MRKPSRHRKQRYRFFVSSETDARKKPVSFSISKSLLIFVFCAATFFVLILSGAAVAGLVLYSGYPAQIEILQKKIDGQSRVLEETAKELEALKKSIKDAAHSRALSPAQTQQAAPAAESPAPAALGSTMQLQAVISPDTVLEAGPQAAAEEKKKTEIISTGPYSKINGKIELIDWFHGGSKAFPRGTKATVIDLKTGLRFRVRRFGGKYHADSEPLTREDTAVMFKICGGKWSWDRRAIVVQIGDRYIAASMNCRPHMTNPNKNNNFPGHFCIHLLNSKVHQTGKECSRHQKCVMDAFKNGNSVIE